MTIHPTIRNHAIALSRVGLAFTAAFAGGAIMIASVAAYIDHTPRTVCAIEVTMNDGNIYRASVADTCAEAWQGFKFESLAGRDWQSVIAVAVDK